MKRAFLLFSCFLLSSFLVFAQKPGGDSKLSYDLQRLIPGNGLLPVTGGDGETSYDYLMYNSNGKLLVNLLAKDESNALIEELKTKGISTQSFSQYTVTVAVSTAQLDDLNSLQELRRATPEYKPMHGAVTSQGDASMKSNIARTTYGLTGAGVKVGVISDSYNFLGGAGAGVTAGELPGPGNPDGFLTPVQVLADIPGGYSGSDEGRAMVEIVHDVAPGATKAFATGYESQSDFANNIIALKDAACNIIVDDLIYFAEPFFQNGIVAKAVNTVKAAGVSYFSSAGNNSNKGYENSYQEGTFSFPGVPYATGNAAHNFAAPGNTPVYQLPLTLRGGSSYTVVLQWDEPFKSVSGGAGAVTDLDIFLYNAAGTGISAGSNSVSIGADPIEVFQVTIGGTVGSAQTRYLAINRYEGPAPGRLRIMILGNGAPVAFSNATIPGINESTCYGHANATGAIATAAAGWFNTPAFGVNPPVVETFSSRGGTPMLFDDAGVRLPLPIVLQKPEITGPDGGNNSFFGNDSGTDADALPNFFGTSASAPHLAAVAALMIESRKGNAFTPDQLKNVMLNSCIDMDDPDLPGFQTGFDYRTGNGLLQADVAIAQANCITPTFTFTETSGLTNNDGTICAGASVTITASGGGTYLWNTSATTASITVSPGMTTTYTVAVNGCSPAAMPVVNVNQLPIVSITGPNPVCQGLTTTLSPASGGTWVSNSPTIASVTNAGLVTALLPGFVTFTFTSTTTGCSATTGDLTIKPTPTSALTASKYDVCPNTEVTLDAHCSIPTSTINWNPGAPTVTPNAATIPYIYKASCVVNGCVGNESGVEVRTHRILVDMKDLDVGTLPLPIVRAVKDNMAPTNTINAPVFPRRWTFIANGCDASESAVFKLSGPVNFMAIDNAATYAMFANDAGGFYAIDHPNYGNGGSFPNGNYTLTVDLRNADGVGGPFPKNRIATGSLLATRTLQFTVGNSAIRMGAEEFTVSDSPLIEPFAQVSPNPISNTLHLQVSGAAMQKVNVHLLDASGRSLLQRDFIPQSNQHREEFEVSHLTHGMYFIKVATEQNQATLKVLKVQ